MRIFRAGGAALCLAAALAACSGSGDTGSAGGWKVSGGRIKIVSNATPCPTSAPVVDTFMATPSPNPSCTPAAKGNTDADASPDASAPPGGWQSVRTQSYSGTGSGDGSQGNQQQPQPQSTGDEQWHTIYTTYTSPPNSDVYQPMVRSTNQPMPTPFNNATPTPLRTPNSAPTPFPTIAPPTTAPVLVQPSATPY